MTGDELLVEMARLAGEDRLPPGRIYITYANYEGLQVTASGQVDSTGGVVATQVATARTRTQVA